MENFLVLNFNNAVLFGGNYNRFKKRSETKDRFVDNNRKLDMKRQDTLVFSEPITRYQISNVLHVLFGERPVPSFRVVPYKKKDYLFDKAMKSYLKIDNYLINDKFIGEKRQHRKFAKNAWSTQVQLTWAKVEAYLGDDLYPTFKTILSNILKINLEEHTFVEVYTKIKKTRDDLNFDRLKNFLIENKKGTFNRVLFLDELDKINQYTMSHKVRRIQNISIEENVIKLHGSILVPVTYDDIDVIKKFGGLTTLLDGGMVYIDSVKSENDINFNEYKLVGEISTKKINYESKDFV